MRLIFMRHGIPDLMYGNGKCTGQAKCVGQTNYPLSAAGCGKIEKSALELKENNTPHVIYSSPLLRCVQSSCILRPYFDCGIYFTEGLAEIYMGEWENLLFSEIKARYPQEYHRRGCAMEDYCVPGGESFREVQMRAAVVVRQAAADAAADDTILFVTHIGVIRSLLCLYEDRPLAHLFEYSLDYGEYVEVSPSVF